MKTKPKLRDLMAVGFAVLNAMPEGCGGGSRYVPDAPADAAGPVMAVRRGDDRYLTTRQAAQVLRHSYGWLSRSWRQIGFHPTNFGYPRLFDRLEIEKYMLANRAVLRGRPKKARSPEVGPA